MGSKKGKRAKLVATVPTCQFCFQPEKTQAELGRFLSDSENKIHAHEYCLFFASALAQNGEPDEGLEGYQLQDIEKEVRRADKLSCRYCKKKGAATGCGVLTCKVKYHLPCGINNGCQNHFFKEHSSFCLDHRQFQPKLRVKGSLRIPPIACLICLELFTYDPLKHLYCPKCLASFHRECIQEYSHQSGYYLRCVKCRDWKDFRTEMKRNGIRVLRREAAWAPDVDGDLQRAGKPTCCPSGELDSCLCPEGREHDDSTSSRWFMLVCATCRANSAHIECAGMTDADDDVLEDWSCHVCAPIVEGRKAGAISNGDQRPSSLPSDSLARPSDELSVAPPLGSLHASLAEDINQEKMEQENPLSDSSPMGPESKNSQKIDHTSPQPDIQMDHSDMSPLPEPRTGLADSHPDSVSPQDFPSSSLTSSPQNPFDSNQEDPFERHHNFQAPLLCHPTSLEIDDSNKNIDFMLDKTSTSNPLSVSNLSTQQGEEATMSHLRSKNETALSEGLLSSWIPRERIYMWID